MSTATKPAGAWRHQGISDLVEALRAAGFAVGTSEAIDATQLVLALASSEPALEDPARLRTRLRPVFCKSREEQGRFDAIFDAWWKKLVRRFEQAPLEPAPKPARPVSTAPAPRSSSGRWTAVAAVVALAVLLVLWSRDRVDLEMPPEKAGQAPSSLPPAPAPRPVETVERAEIIDRFVPAVRHTVELRPVWVWLLAALPLGALIGISLPALVLARTRLRRRSEPMFLDPAPLAREARKLVPPLPAEIADKLARHVNSRGIDIERLARRPVLDVRGTLEATIRNYGIPTLKFSYTRFHPSYLLLIDVANERDPRGRLFYQWALRLHEQKLDVEILLVRVAVPATVGPGAVQVCPPGAASRDERNWKPLAQLRAPRAGERLAVVSDGDPLVDAKGVWRPEVVRARLHRWRDRALFTPTEPRDWGAREQEIENAERLADPGFIVLPLDESALGAWVDLMLTGQLTEVTLSDPQRFPALLRHGQFSAFAYKQAPPPETVEKLIAQLRVYLGEAGFYWFAACAVAPLVRWELTLLLGQAVLKSLPRLTDERALAEALPRNYQRLVHLPWLQRESIPEWLRLRLLVELGFARQAELRDLVEHLLGKLSPRATTDGIELKFDRPPGAEGARPERARRSGEDARATGDDLYLGYMSGLTPEQLVLRAPTEWAPWASQFPLRRPGGPRGWIARLRERARAEWAKWAWMGGLPHLGFNRRSLVFAALSALPLLALLLLAGRAPLENLPAQVKEWLYAERARLLAWRTDDATLTVAVSPDGTRVVTGGLDNTLRQWDAKTGAPIGEPMRGHTEWVASVAFSPDGTRIVSGSYDQTLRLWDAKAGAPIGEPMEGHTDPVLSVAFSPDGTRIVSGSYDQTLRLWDAKTGAPIGEPLRGHTGWVTQASRLVQTARGSSREATTRRCACGMRRPARHSVSRCAATPTGYAASHSAPTVAGLSREAMMRHCANGMRRPARRSVSRCAATPTGCAASRSLRVANVSSRVALIEPCGCGMRIRAHRWARHWLDIRPQCEASRSLRTAEASHPWAKTRPHASGQRALRHPSVRRCGVRRSG